MMQNQHNKIVIILSFLNKRSSFKWKIPKYNFKNQPNDIACKISIKFKERKPEFICVKLERIIIILTEKNI